MTTSKLLCQGCIDYRCYGVDDLKKEETTKEIPIICEFRFNFWKITRTGPQREIDYEINQLLELDSFSKPPAIWPQQSLELKTVLDKLLLKRFIKPSLPPWGGPVLFVKKKNDGAIRLCIE